MNEKEREKGKTAKQEIEKRDRELVHYQPRQSVFDAGGCQKPHLWIAIESYAHQRNQNYPNTQLR